MGEYYKYIDISFGLENVGDYNNEEWQLEIDFKSIQENLKPSSLGKSSRTKDSRAGGSSSSTM